MSSPPSAAEQLNANPPPLARLLGIDIVEASPAGVIARLTVRDEICTQGGILHGGAFMALADTVGAVVTTRATPVHVGRRTSVWQTRITNAGGKLLALVVQTQLAV